MRAAHEVQKLISDSIVDVDAAAKRLIADHNEEPQEAYSFARVQLADRLKAFVMPELAEFLAEDKVRIKNAKRSDLVDAILDLYAPKP